MKVIVGLGNPGKNYNKTRHNIGFMLLDNYLGNVKFSSFENAEIYETNLKNEKVLFVKPTTFMNLSGLAVQKILSYYKVSPNDMLVIQDDLDLPEESYRLKFNSSAGGHNGIKNIIECIGTKEFARLKIGIGKDDNIDTKDYVLSKVSKSLYESLSNSIYIKIIDSFILNGIEKTMNDFNNGEK